MVEPIDNGDLIHLGRNLISRPLLRFPVIFRNTTQRLNGMPPYFVLSERLSEPHTVQYFICPGH